MNDRDFLDKKKELTRMHEIFTNREAANFLKTSTITLWRERKAGRISFHRVASKIVYTREDLDDYLMRNKREAFGIQRNS